MAAVFVAAGLAAGGLAAGGLAAVGLAAALAGFAAVAATPSRRERLGSITAPTLVIHGEQDPCLPIEHGRALARAIPGAKLVTIAEMGHMLHPSLIHDIAELILAHMRAQRA